jgi:hypothetical protein
VTKTLPLVLRSLSSRVAQACILVVTSCAFAKEPLTISVNWSERIAVSKTTLSTQIIPNALMRRGHPFHDVSLSAIRKLDMHYVRYLPWGPYPRLQIAELYPPTTNDTFWNFSNIDPELLDFLESTKSHEPVINFSEVPPWMFTPATRTTYADDVDKMDWGCSSKSGSNSRLPKLIDPTGKQLADYYARIVSWYTKGGFEDENGKYHTSDHKYDLPWWGVLNELDFLGPEQYSALYDAIVSAIREVSPNTRFLALELSGTAVPGMSDPQFFEYFLDRKNHKAGIPIDMISYHFYALPAKSQTLDSWQYTLFDQADGFLAQVRFIESIRKRLSPSTQVYLDELGSMLPADTNICMANASSGSEIPTAYWNLSAALFAYLYTDLVRQGIDVVGQAGFLFYPGNFPSVSMVDWTTGKLNARFYVLQLIKENFAPGDELVSTRVGIFPNLEDVVAQGFDTARGRKLLVINKRAYGIDLRVDTVGQLEEAQVVDKKSGERPARTEMVSGKTWHLGPFAVAVVSIR